MGDTGRLALAVAILVAALLVVSALGRLDQHRDATVALVRAVAQLALVGFVIRLVLVRPVFAPAYLLVMLAAAARTSSRRIAHVDHAFVRAATAIAAGALLVTAIVWGTGVLPRDARDLVPFAAQVIGGAMTATTLAATRMRDDVLSQWDVVEAALALGAAPRQAVADVARSAAARALVPALDQTRNVGLVVLPGAYVGLLLAGATPAEAGRVQFLVLLGLLVAESLAAVTVTRLLADPMGRHKPLDVH